MIESTAEAAAWCVVGVTLALAVTQAVGWSRSMLVAVGQALTVVLGVLCVAGVIAGLLRSSWPLTVGALVAVAATTAVVAPAVRRRTPAGATGATPTLSVLHANLLFENTQRDHEVAAALLGEDADVLALSELNPGHEGALLAGRRGASYPHRFSRPTTNADGMAVWSRHPLADVEWLTLDMRPTLIATVCPPGAAPVRIVLAHNNPPTTRAGLRNWEPSMVAIHGAATTPGPPTMIVADLNASRWHPPFRRLLARGWRDAHEAAGRGLSVSWRTNGPCPIPFVRLDHALLGDGLDLVAIRDVDVPGSDHRAFVVTVAVTSPSRRTIGPSEPL